MTRTIIFDLDGTLVDSRYDLAVAGNHARAALGLPELPMADVLACVGEGAEKLVERLTPERTPDDRRTALAAFRTFYLDHCTVQTAAYAGIIETVDALRAHGFTLAVATNKPLAFTKRILAHTGLSPRFAAVRGGDAAKKPEPTQLLELFAETHAAPANGWMVGDHFTDLAAAKAAGCRSVFCRWGIGQPRGHAPDAVADHPADIARVIIERN